MHFINSLLLKPLKQFTSIFFYFFSLSILIACSSSGDSNGTKAPDVDGIDNNNGTPPPLVKLAAISINSALWDATAQILSVEGTFTPNDDDWIDSLYITDVDLPRVVLAKVSITTGNSMISWNAETSNLTVIPCTIKIKAGNATDTISVANSTSNCGDGGNPPANTAPTAVIASTPAANAGTITIRSGDSINYTGLTSSDPDGNNPLTYNWLFAGGSSAASTMVTPSAVQYNTMGSFQTSLNVADSLGLGSSVTSVTVIVLDATANLPPTATITSTPAADASNNININTGNNVNFSGISSTDADGNTPLTYAWTFAGGTPANSTVVMPGNFLFNTAGTYQVTLTVTDSLGLPSTMATVNVVVVDPLANIAPTATITSTPAADSSNNININTGDSVNFSGSGSTDTDGNTPLTYAWTFANRIPANSTTVTPGNVQYNTAGTYQVTLTVTDSLDLTSAMVIVDVVVADPLATNIAPTAIITSTPAADASNNININTGDTVNFSASGSTDTDGNTPLTYAWTFAGATSAKSTVVTPGDFLFKTVGIYEFTLTVTDSLGLPSTMATVNVVVVDPLANIAPTAIVTSTPATDTSNNININIGDNINFSGSGSTDTDGNTPLTYSWTFANGIPASSTIVTPGNVLFDTAGTYQATLIVTDSLGLPSTMTSVNVVVVDSAVIIAPTAIITSTPVADSLGNININSGDSINFSGSASNDADGNIPLTYAWTFTSGTPASDTTITPGNVLFSTAGTYVISLAVTDSNDNADPTPAQVTVIVTDLTVNLPPIGSISHDNGNGTTGSIGDLNITAGIPIIFNGSASDPDGDAVTSYAWNFNGANASSTTTSGPITVIFSTPGANLVSLTVTDINGNIDPTPAQLTVNVNLPAFKFLPVLNNNDFPPVAGFASYTLNAVANINVDVVTPLGNWTTPMMRYNGSQLPLLIKAARGTQMSITLNNNLAEDTTVHWHGFKIPADQDGGPNFPIAMGATNTYSFTLAQPAGSLWFHPHAHGTTAEQVYRGLAGAFIITDDITANLESTKQIPAGDQDVVLMLQDRRFAADNGSGERSLIYSAGGMMATAGMLGDHVLVNGVELPGLNVDSSQYRFRVFNGSNARTFDIALADGAQFYVVGTDGGLLNAPVQTNHVMLAAGERAEIVVDFSNYAVGDNVMLVSRAFTAGGMMGGGALPNGAAFNIMRFEISTQVVDDVVLYTALPATADINTRLTEADASVTRNFVMSMGIGMQFFINGKVFDITRVDETVTSGATEIWDISNMSGMAHPFHAHAIQWQILDRRNINGIVIVKPAAGVDLGWKDTVLVQPGESVRMIGRFDPVINVGVYMYHCHILEHEEAGMMGTFEVLP